MSAFFAKPEPDKSIFENYKAHLNFKDRVFSKLIVTIRHTDSLSELSMLLLNELRKSFNAFERLRDSYDYYDEIAGATVVPVIAVGFGIATLLKSAVELLRAFLTFVQLIDEDTQDHLQTATAAAAYSLFSFGLAVYSFATSALSLISRPIITVREGFAEQDVERFDYNYDLDDYEESTSELMSKFLSR